MTSDAPKRDFAEIVARARALMRDNPIVHTKFHKVMRTTMTALGYASLITAPFAGAVMAGNAIADSFNTPVATPAAAPTPPPEQPTLNKRDSISCHTGARTAFNNQSRQINMTGETGVGMAASYGYDQNCRPFTLRFYDLYHAMLGRHNVLMNDSYQSSGYRNQLQALRREIAEDPARFDMNTRKGRMEVLQLVNSRVNAMFTYQADDQVFYRSDYFASPIETMVAGNGNMRGDCDDYATTKYIILRDLGFDTNTLFLSVVSRTEVNATNHAVLMVNIEGSHPAQPRYQVLDNDAAARIVDSMASGYKTYMVFNGSGAYIFPQALHATGEIDLRFMTPERPFVTAPPRLKEDRVQARLS